MSLDPTLEEQELLADSLRRPVSRMSGRELTTETLSCAAFLAACAGLWLARPPHALQLVPAGICLVVLLLTTFVEFETPLGFTVPIQLGFVPLLFALPLALVAPAVAVALTLARLPDVIRGRSRPERLLVAVGNAFFALGPVAVFVLAGVSPEHAGAGLLVGALLAQFATDFTFSALRWAIDRGADLASQLRDSWIYLVDAALSGVALVVAEQVRRTPAAALAVVPLLAILATFARERHARLQSLLELNGAYRGTALVLGDVIEADDGYTGEHSKSVVALTLEVAERFGLEPTRLRNLEFGALLHDVGKIAIPKEIINKPGKLEPAEWTLVKTHTIEGQRMLERVGGFLSEVGVIVRSHHERWDGGGYPDGLAGEAIPLESRIISCCDTWNAMRTDRPYRTALSYEAALAELRACSGTQLDPAVVEALIAVLQPAAASTPAPTERAAA